MSAERLRVLLPSDVFPPRCGGAGWSAHALSLALLGRGHEVRAVVPRVGAAGVSESDVLGVPTVQMGYRVAPVPVLKNYTRHERLWPRLAGVLVAQAAAFGRPDAPLVIHAQHVQVAPAAVLAGQQLGAPVVVTIRDHWPWDYFATGLHGNRIPHPRQTLAALATDLVARQGPLQGSLLLPLLPYMLGHLRRRQAFLRRADAVIAVSHYIADRLAEIVPADRIYVVPNMVDLSVIARKVATPPASATPGQPYMLFVGKLEHNKGAQLLPAIVRAVLHGLDAPDPALLPELIIAGDGPLAPSLERELAALGVRVRLLAWIDHDEVLRLMAHSTVLLFPSAWGEPLSRVLLEASACGATILAMPTGGTGDVVQDGVNGALEPTPEHMARRLQALLADPAERQRLGAAIRATAEKRFAASEVVQQVERVYGNVGCRRLPV